MAGHADQFDRKLYTIEPGSAVNENIRRMLDDGALACPAGRWWNSSEQGMLGEVDRAVRDEEWILFIAWEPHPMNTKLDLTYLPGADDVFRPESRQRHGPDPEPDGVPRRLSEPDQAVLRSSISPRRWRTR